MTKYDTQFKLNVVKNYLKTGSQYQTAKLYGINTSEVRRWTLVYQHHGLSSLEKQSNQSRSVEHKLEILKHIKLNGVYARLAAAQFNIPSPSTIARWQRLYNQPYKLDSHNATAIQNTLRVLYKKLNLNNFLILNFKPTL